MAKVVLTLDKVQHRHQRPAPRWFKPWASRPGPGIVHLSLDLHEGAILGLVGPNGAGKTTLLRVMAGILPVQQGTVKGRFQSETLREVEDLRPWVGHMPEQVRWQGHRSVVEALTELADMRNVPMKRVLSLVKLVGLSDRSDEPLNNLSQGMRQRLSIAAALLGSPKVLLLDEPFNGLDPVAARAFGDLVKRLASKGVSVVVSSHMVGHLNGLIDRVALLHQGQLLDEGPLKEVELRLGLAGRYRAAGSGILPEHLLRCSEVEVLEHRSDGAGWELTFRGVASTLIRKLMADRVSIERWGPVEPDLVEWLCAATGMEVDDISMDVQAPAMVPLAGVEVSEDE